MATKIGADQKKFLEEMHSKYDIVQEWKHESVSTGILSLDLATGKGGMPRGLLVDLYGDEGLGKTTMCLAIAAERVRNGERVVYLDVEKRLRNDLVMQIVPGTFTETDKEGVEHIRQENNMFEVFRPPTGENAFSLVQKFLVWPDYRMIVLDSVADLVFEEDLEEDKHTRQIGLLARRVGLFSTKLLGDVYKYGAFIVFINQMRVKMSNYGPAYKDSTGGNTIRFNCSLRVKMSKDKPEDIKEGDKIVGKNVKLKVEKNSFGAPERETNMPVMFGYGIDRTQDFINCATEMGVLKRAGGHYTITQTDDAGKTIREIKTHGEDDLAVKIAPHLNELREWLRGLIVLKAAQESAEHKKKFEDEERTRQAFKDGKGKTAVEDKP